jgi:hypothetical protein
MLRALSCVAVVIDVHYAAMAMFAAINLSYYNISRASIFVPSRFLRPVFRDISTRYDAESDQRPRS